MAKCIHRSDHSRFEINIGDATAVLEYHLAEKVMTIHHTFVPVKLRGQSIAARLAKAAFDHARAKGFKIIPQCSYIARYAKRFPEAGALIIRA